MLTQIQAARIHREGQSASLAEELAQGGTQDAIELLLSCHQRIRHFTRLAVLLSQAPATAAEVAQAALAVHRYYSQALPLHEADENESVYPRLRAAAPPAELAAANQAMVDQHRALDANIARLLPLWTAIAAAPARAAEARAGAEQLQEAWDEHLELEERCVFPALREWLSPLDLEAIRREMRERRALAAAI
ncbi:MAG: hemerythrin domain-containing protein [Terriglobales bacterium]